MLEQEISWTCADCGATSVSPPDSSRDQGLNLPLADGDAASAEQPLALHALLRDFADETLDIRCDGDVCSARRQIDAEQGLTPREFLPRRRTWRIARAPAVLCVNLRRHHQDAFGRACKLRTAVDYPEDLDLGAFTADGTALRYRLYGVAAHAGESADGGHWIAAVRHSDGRHYRTVNDSVVEYEPAQTFDELRHPNSLGEWFDPTVLVYVKTEGK